VLEASAHQGLPYALLWQKALESRVPAQPDVRFDFAIQSEEANVFPGLIATRVALPPLPPGQALRLFVQDQGQELTITADFSVEFFDQEAIRAAVAEWRDILKWMMEEPEAQLGSFRRIGPEDSRIATPKTYVHNAGR